MLEIEEYAVDEDKVLKRVGDSFDEDAQVLRYKVLETEGYDVDEGQVFE